MRRKTHERIVANLQRDHAAQLRQLFDIVGQQNDRLMWLAGSPFQPAQGPPEPDEPEPDLDDLPMTAVEQYPYD